MFVATLPVCSLLRAAHIVEGTISLMPFLPPVPVPAVFAVIPLMVVPVVVVPSLVSFRHPFMWRDSLPAQTSPWPHRPLWFAGLHFHGLSCGKPVLVWLRAQGTRMQLTLSFR
jgi:hypothetical protein